MALLLAYVATALARKGAKTIQIRKGRFCDKWNYGTQPTGISKFPASYRPALPFDRCKRLLRPRDRHRAAPPACSGGDPVPGEDATLRHGLREPFPSSSAAV